MAHISTAQKAKSSDVRDLTIVGDFIKYLLISFVPFFIIGLIYGIIYDCYFMCIIFNPIIYAAGVASVVIVIRYEVNDILALIGRAKEPQLGLQIKYAKQIQLIGLQMSSRDFQDALKTVNNLLKQEPNYTNALNLKGQILMDGFKNYDEARSCFEQVIKLAKQDTEDYNLARELRASTYID